MSTFTLFFVDLLCEKWFFINDYAKSSMFDICENEESTKAINCVNIYLYLKVIAM